MVNVIYKYPIPLKNNFKIELHKGFSITDIGMQNGLPYMWVYQDTCNTLVEYNFYSRETGQVIPKGALHVGLYKFVIGQELVVNIFLESKKGSKQE